MQPNQATETLIPDVIIQEEAPKIKTGVSETDTLTRGFIKKLKGYTLIRRTLDKVGVYLGGDATNMIYYYFHYLNNEVFKIEAYIMKYEAPQGQQYEICPWQDVAEAKLGRALKIEELDKTEIEYKYLIGIES